LFVFGSEYGPEVMCVEKHQSSALILSSSFTASALDSLLVPAKSKTEGTFEYDSVAFSIRPQSGTFLCEGDVAADAM